MNINNEISQVVKVEEVSTVIVIDEDPKINSGRCGRSRRPKPKKNVTDVTKLKRQLELAMLRLAVKTKEVEDLEQKLKNINYANHSHVCIQKPMFSTTQTFHPLNFIEDLIQYLDKLPEMNRTIDTVVDCLEGDARNWATIFKPRWIIIDDFIVAFLDQFWGMEEQSLLRKQILNGKWFGKAETMCRHFTYLVSQARWLKNKMTEDQLVYELMHHYPKHVQVAWYISNQRTVLEATEFLKKMDEVEVLNMGKKRARQRQNMRMHYVLHCDKQSQAPMPVNPANNTEDTKRLKPE